MEVKPTITKSLNERKVVVENRVKVLRDQIALGQKDIDAKTKEVTELEAELADINEFLSVPAEG